MKRRDHLNRGLRGDGTQLWRYSEARNTSSLKDQELAPYYCKVRCDTDSIYQCTDLLANKRSNTFVDKPNGCHPRVRKDIRSSPYVDIVIVVGTAPRFVLRFCILDNI